MMADPFLAKVSRLAWRIDDPRVLEHLRHENDPARTHREQAIGDRARNAGWPPADAFRSRKTATVAITRLEGVSSRWNGSNHNDVLFRGQVAYESRRRGAVTTIRGGILPVEEDDTGAYNRDDGPGTIFDE
jgi:hypothetical protein